MTFFNNILLALTIALFSFSCSNNTQKEPETDVKEKIEKTPKEVLDGIKTLYYPDGQIKSTITFSQGKKNGLSTSYYTNGNKSLEINYVNNIKNGQLRRYYEDGTIYKEASYSDGMLNGFRKIYHPNGQLNSSQEFYLDLPGNNLEEYSKSGKKRQVPKIKVREVNEIAKNGTFTLIFSLDPFIGNAKFYSGSLMHDKFLDPSPKELPETKKGECIIVFRDIPENAFLARKINVIAKYKTYYGNEAILNKNYNLVID